MKIMLFEKDLELANKIDKEFDKLHHEFLFVEDINEAHLRLKNSQDIDLIIFSVDSMNPNCYNDLKKIRDFQSNIFIIILSSGDFNYSVKDIIDLKIEAFIYKNDFIKILETEVANIDNRLHNKHLNQTFKEFSYYSETDINGNIIEVSESLCDLTGYSKEELIGQKHSILKFHNDDNLKYKELWKTITKGQVWTGELQIDNKKGDILWYKTIIFPILCNSGKIKGFGSKRHDVTTKKHFEELSVIDGLTGLYNRRHFDNIFPKEIQRAKRSDEKLIFIIIDIDKFKLYNDFYGHPQGDVALRKLSRVLRNNYKRANDFIFRIGGEEFVVITSTNELKKSLKFLENINNDLKKEHIAHEKAPNKYLTVSIGAFVIDQKDNYTEDEIYNFADTALYQAKNESGNRVVIYNNIVQTETSLIV